MKAKKKAAGDDKSLEEEIFTDDDFVAYTNEVFAKTIKPAILAIVAALSGNYAKLSQYLSRCSSDHVAHLMEEAIFRRLFTLDWVDRLRLWGRGPSYSFYMAEHLAVARRSIAARWWRQLPAESRQKLNNPDYELELWVSASRPIIKVVSKFKWREFEQVLDRHSGILTLEEQRNRFIACHAVDGDRAVLDELVKVEVVDGSVLLYNKRGHRIIASKARLRKYAE